MLYKLCAQVFCAVRTIKFGATAWSRADLSIHGRLKIQDDKIGKDELAAWACIRMDRLRSGYRFVHLLDAKGMQSSGVLLVKITKRFS